MTVSTWVRASSRLAPTATSWARAASNCDGIGGYLGTCDLYYTGDVDDVAIFSQALPIDKSWAPISMLFPKPLR
jgi:hypothetical protein